MGHPVDESKEIIISIPKLNNYYTINLANEKSKNDWARRGYLFLGVAVVIAAVAATVFLFSFTVDAVFYIPYIAIMAIGCINTLNIQNNYTYYFGQSDFIQTIIETIPNVDLSTCDFRWRHSVTEPQKKQFFARYVVVRDAACDRHIRFANAYFQMDESTETTKLAFVHEFDNAKKSYLEGLKELAWLDHLIDDPFDTRESKDYIPPDAVDRFQAVQNLSIRYA